MTGGRAVVVGAGGGIGAALVRALQARGCEVVGLSRSGDGLDVTDEASVKAAAERVGAPADMVIVATGLLHGDGVAPERSMRELDGLRLARLFAVNAIGPALVAKHFVPLLPREGRSVFAALSARVGSISDNRLGGWYGYRASKAALNQIIRTLAIEVARSRPHAAVVGLHPGTVDTGLSAPFQRGVPEGGLFTPEFAAERLLTVLDGLGPGDSGGCFAWDGERVPE